MDHTENLSRRNAQGVLLSPQPVRQLNRIALLHEGRVCCLDEVVNVAVPKATLKVSASRLGHHIVGLRRLWGL